MIFWGTVLAFILGIMYYMLYPYDTKISTVYMPSSEAYVAGFVTQHQAAKDYAREAVIAINHITNKLTPVSTGSSDKISILLLSHSDSDQSPIDSFLPEGISSVQTNNFRPSVNSGAQSDDIIDFSSGFVSLLTCFNQPERKYTDSNEYTEAKLTDCRAATTKYVMTYGPVPDELDRPYMRGKTLLWEAALLKRTKGNPDCGFLYYDDKTGRYFVNNSHHLTRTVPKDFIDLLKSGYFNNHSNGRVLVGSDLNNKRELLFCMTPVNDPYPRLGLKVLLDGTVNQLPDDTFQLEHSGNIPDDGWLNLVKEKNAVGNAAEIKGISANERWNPSCAKTSSLCHANGFYFNKGRSVSIPFGWFDSNNTDVLGVPSTVSFFALFNSGNYTVFETQTNGSTDANNYLRAHYSSGNQLTITLSSNGKTYSLSAEVSVNRMHQIDYVLNAGGHKLYVDGELKQEGSFESEIGFIKGTSLVLGGVSSDYVLYNFLVYNRSPEDSSVKINTFDLFGLPRIYKSNTLRYLNKIGDFQSPKKNNYLQRRTNE